MTSVKGWVARPEASFPDEERRMVYKDHDAAVSSCGFVVAVALVWPGLL